MSRNIIEIHNGTTFQGMTLQEQVARYCKRVSIGKDIDYLDFTTMVLMHMEFEFIYRNRIFEIVWSPKGMEFYKDQRSDYSKTDYEFYIDPQHFFENARIDGNRIVEIFNEITF